MVRVLYKSDVDGAQGDMYYYQFAGKSTDTKPASTVAMGSRYTEADTGKKFQFNETSGLWVETDRID